MRRALLHQLVSETGFSPEFPRVEFSVAGVTVGILTDDPATLGYLRRYYASYPADSEPDVEVCVLRAGEESLWEDPDPEFRFERGVVIQRDFAARRIPHLPPRYRDRAVALIGPETEDAVHNLLRWLLVNPLLRKNAFLLHGAGMIRDGRGYALFGQSGAGKSTATDLIAGSDPGADPR